MERPVTKDIGCSTVNGWDSHDSLCVPRRPRRRPHGTGVLTVDLTVRVENKDLGSQ